MGKTSKWLKNFLSGKKEKEKEKQQNATNYQNSTNTINENPVTPNSNRPTTPKEKRRWSFRRSSATASSNSQSEQQQIAVSDSENEQKKHAMAMAAATAAAADAAVAAAQAAAAVIRLTAAANGRNGAVEEAAAVTIQSFFRSYLARKALCALRGLVKLQALVRGHLVRKQATATLRCMQALVTVQARARAQRIRMAEDGDYTGHRQSNCSRKSTQENRFRHSNYEMEDNVKIVEMDHGQSKTNTKSRNSYSNQPQPQQEQYYPYPKQDNYQTSPATSALTEISPQGYSTQFEDYSFSTAQSSPHYYSAISKPDPAKIPLAFPRPEYTESLCYDHPLYPSYMANTESSRAKARSQSAPKQRPDWFERQPSTRRRASVEGRNVPRAMRMQRSSSHVGSTAQNYHYPWSIKLDRSNVSLKDSECGSTSTMLTNTTYCRTLVGFEVDGNRY